MGLRGILISTLAMATLLSACSPERDLADIDDWFHNNPSSMEKSVGQMPRGYTGQNDPRVLKPTPLNETLPAEAAYVASSETPLPPPPVQPPLEELPAPLHEELSAPSPNEGASSNVTPADTPSSSLTWNEVPLPGKEQPCGEPYSPEVTVFPLEGGGAAFSSTASFSQAPSKNRPYGQLVQEIYFPHGSTGLGAGDKRQLADLASAIKRISNDVTVTVVGHASKRLPGVDDPIEKKMMNFEMAQKRASAVTLALSGYGVDPEWIGTVSKGDDEPNLRPGTRSQEDADRRVEIFMRSK